MDKTSIILKSDSRGRVRTPPERREALVAEFERSGLPATKFSALVGVRQRCQAYSKIDTRLQFCYFLRP